MADKVSERPPARAGLARPGEGSARLRADERQWQDCGEEGFLIQPLLDGSSGGVGSMLMKLLPGCYSPLHAHEELEQVFVLEGSFHDQDATYAAGDYLVRAPGSLHSAASDEGALLLVIYSPADDPCGDTP